jgi:hypothetical protein
MSAEHEPLSEHEAELAPLLRDALRAHTPPGLTEAQREVLERETRGAGRPPWRRRLWVALACALPLALLASWQALQPEVAPIAAERSEPLSRPAERPDVARVEATAEAERAAEAAARAESAARAAAAAESVQAASDDKILRPVAGKSGGGEGAELGDPAKARCVPAETRGKKHSARAAKSCPPSAGSRASSGGCDPNDPLCGL